MIKIIALSPLGIVPSGFCQCSEMINVESVGKNGKYKCPCCGYYTLDERGGYDICPVCFWEDDAFLIPAGEEFVGARVKGVDDDQLLDTTSGANHGLTLREGRENFRKFGACEQEMKKHVRKPRESEYPENNA